MNKSEVDNMETNEAQTVTDGETNGATNGETNGIKKNKAQRYKREAYGIFGFGVFSYHLVLFCLYVVSASFGNYISGLYGIFFCCGAISSLITCIWLIIDVTVHYANRGSDVVTKICCCCQCINGWIMLIPIAIAAALRIILWFILFGIAHDVLIDIIGDDIIDNEFWICLLIGAVDVFPLVLLAIDWWWYYIKTDYDALFGTKIYPLRCITGESIIVMLLSWSLIGFYDGIVDDDIDNIFEVMWLWILHGIVSTAILLFAAFLQFSGSVRGNKLNNGLFVFICWCLGILQGILILIVWVYVIYLAFSGVGGYSLVGIYYAGITIPTVRSLFSFEFDENVAAYREKVENYEK